MKANVNLQGGICPYIWVIVVVARAGVFSGAMRSAPVALCGEFPSNHVRIKIRPPWMTFFCLRTSTNMISLSSSLPPDPSIMSSEVTPLAPRLSLPGSPESLLPSSASPPESFPSVISNGAFSKTWILPPRKKPGRKAANDVPPTVLRFLRVILTCRNDKRRIGWRRKRFEIERLIG